EVEGEPRFRMLETIRDYASERLLETGEAEQVRAQHADIFLHLAEQAEQELIGAGQGAWLDRLEREHYNLRAAISYSLERGDIKTAARIAGALRRFWYLHAHITEGREWLDKVLTS